MLVWASCNPYAVTLFFKAAIFSHTERPEDKVERCDVHRVAKIQDRDCPIQSSASLDRDKGHKTAGHKAITFKYGPLDC